MTDFITNVKPPPLRRTFDADLRRLVASDRTVIAHIDAGIAPHVGLGYNGDIPPPNLLIAKGRNFFDPTVNGNAPITPLARDPGLAAQLTEFPDHGVKTLSVILSNLSGRLIGMAPGAKVIPYRVANGPLFRRGDGPMMSAPTAKIGEAVRHALTHPEVRVMSVSMGNPGFVGPLEPLRQAFRGEVGMSKATGDAIDAAYEAGVILVCAAGQILDRVVYPARYPRTIAVGGYDTRGALYDHYPPNGYGEPRFVDIWARAQRINRASVIIAANPPKPIWANSPDNPEAEPSGTSYATPQVAAAAAIWVEKFHDELEALFATARWKIVEAFRTALRAAADDHNAKQGNKRVPIKVLNVPKLLGTPPADYTGAKPG
jgi:subtilisin family serine protease